MTSWSPVIRRPVALTFLMASLVIVGMIAWSHLPFSRVRSDGSATIQIQTYYPGVSSDVVSSTVTAPLEKQLKQLAGIRQMSAHSLIGRSVITLQFEPSITLDTARQETQAVIDAASRLLPDNLQMRPLLVAP